MTSPSVMGSTTDTFPLFAWLPEEIRVKIWKGALIPFDTPRVIELAFDDQVRKYSCVNRAALRLNNPHLVAHLIREIVRRANEWWTRSYHIGRDNIIQSQSS